MELFLLVRKERLLSLLPCVDSLSVLPIQDPPQLWTDMSLAFSQLPQPDSLLRSFDPRWKLVAFTVAILCVSFLRSLLPSAIALGVTLAVATLARLPLRWYLIRMLTLLLLLSPFILTVPFLVPDADRPDLPFYVPSRPGMIIALLITSKAVTLVTLVLILLTSAKMDHLLKAARSLKVPGILIHLFLITYRYLFLLIEELGRMRVALRARGFQNRPSFHSYRTIGRLMGILLIRSHERGERVAQAMRCRGFDGEYRALVHFQTNWMDVVVFLLITLGASSLLWWDLMLRA